MKRCTLCILPENYPGISFDDEGVCNVCRSFEKRWAGYDWVGKKKELEEIFERAKSKRRRYDCLVPISGGKDSTYTLYVCSQIYNLRVLAVNFNNGFVSSIATENLSKVASLFNVDYISWIPRWCTLKKAYRTFFLKTGDFCPPCSRAITAFTYRLAQRERIPLIVLGFNPKTDLNPPEIEIIDQKLFKNVVGDRLSQQEKKDFLFFELRRFLTRRIDLPAFIPFVEEKITTTLEDFFDSSGSFSRNMHFDCRVSSVANWLRRKKWGFSKKTQKLSALIRDGQISRSEALSIDESEAKDGIPEKALDYFMSTLDLKMDDINNAKNLSCLNFKHYNRQLIRFIGKATGIIDANYK